MSNTQAERPSKKMIKVNLSNSINLLGVPYIQFDKGDYTLRFLLDTGASMNLIKKEILERFSSDSEILPIKTEYYGIDNVCHETEMYAFKFNLGEFLYHEVFQKMEDASALTFPMEDGELEVHGILGTPFFRDYKACFDYENMEMYFSIPNVA